MFDWLMRRAGGKMLLLAVGLIAALWGAGLAWVASSPLIRVIVSRLPELHWNRDAVYFFETIVVYEQHRASIWLLYGLDSVAAAGIFLFFAAWLGWALRRGQAGPAGPAWVLTLPFLALVGDWWENSFVLFFISLYPTPLIIQLFPLFRFVMLAHFALLALSGLAVLAAAGVWGLRKIIGTKS
ncbi:MAG: hypothetical protein AB1439_01385 [candidate division FCPU426 bacterium]